MSAAWAEALTKNPSWPKELKQAIAQEAITVIQSWGLEPDSNAWRCWWEIQA